MSKMKQYYPKKTRGAEGQRPRSPYYRPRSVTKAAVAKKWEQLEIDWPSEREWRFGMDNADIDKFFEGFEDKSTNIP